MGTLPNALYRVWGPLQKPNMGGYLKCRDHICEALTSLHLCSSLDTFLGVCPGTTDILPAYAGTTLANLICTKSTTSRQEKNYFFECLSFSFLRTILQCPTHFLSVWEPAESEPRPCRWLKYAANHKRWSRRFIGRTAGGKLCLSRPQMGKKIFFR